MSFNAVEVTKYGELRLAGNINTRLPVVRDGLVAHFPFDNTTISTGTDTLYLSATNTEAGTDLLGNHYLDWRDPNNWVLWGGTGTLTWNETENALVANGYGWWYFKGYIYIDPSRSWYVSADMKRVGTNGTMYLGDISYKLDKTTTATQHPGTFEYFGAMGVAVPTTWTTYLNNSMGGVARTGTSSDTNQATFDPSIAFVRPLFIAGYTSGVVGTDKLYIKNLQWYYSNTNNSNTTLTNDGIAVEEATTNYVPVGVRTCSAYPEQKSSSSGNFVYSLLTNVCGRSDVMRIYSSSRAGTDYAVFGFNDMFTSVAGEVYTLSFDYKVIQGTTAPYLYYTYVNGYKVPDTSAAATLGSATIVDLGDGWKRYSRPLTITTGGNTWLRFIYYSCTTSDTEAVIDNIQVEKKAFATSFVNGSRGVGDLKISNILPQHKGTVVLEVTFHEDDTVNGLQGADQYCFGNQLAWNAANAWWFHDTDWWYIRDSNNGLHEASLSSRMVREERTHLAFVYDDTDGTMDIYKNGVLNSGGVKHTDMIGLLGSLGANWTHSGHASSTDYKMCQTIHSLSFYNRPLTVSEIKQLANPTFELTPTGDWITSSITSKPNIPNDAVYFPLGCEARDQYKLITPIAEANTVYEDGAVWLGEATTNLVSNTNLSTGWSQGYCTGIQWNDCPPPAGVISPVVSFYDSNNQDGYWYCYGDYTPQNPSTTYTVSLYVKTNDSNFQISFYTADNSEVDRYWSEYKTVPNDGLWHRIIWNSFTSSASATSDSLSFHFTYGNAPGETQRTWLCAPQMEARAFATPFVTGTRGAGYIKFDDMKTAPQIPSTSPVTYIISFKAPTYTPTDVTNLYSCTENGGFALCLNTSGYLVSYVYNGSSYSVITGSVNYRDNKPHTVALVIGVNDVIVYVDGVEAGRTTGHMTGNTLSYSQTGANYNFFIGTENNNGIPQDGRYFNGYLWDFICIPRECSATEVANIYKEKFTVLNGTQIQTSISTGQVIS